MQAVVTLHFEEGRAGDTAAQRVTTLEARITRAGKTAFYALDGVQSSKSVVRARLRAMGIDVEANSFS